MLAAATAVFVGCPTQETKEKENTAEATERQNRVRTELGKIETIKETETVASLLTKYKNVADKIDEIVLLVDHTTETAKFVEEKTGTVLAEVALGKKNDIRTQLNGIEVEDAIIGKKTVGTLGEEAVNNKVEEIVSPVTHASSVIQVVLVGEPLVISTVELALTPAAMTLNTPEVVKGNATETIDPAGHHVMLSWTNPTGATNVELTVLGKEQHVNVGETTYIVTGYEPGISTFVARPVRNVKIDGVDKKLERPETASANDPRSAVQKVEAWLRMQERRDPNGTSPIPEAGVNALLEMMGTNDTADSHIDVLKGINVSKATPMNGDARVPGLGW